MAKSFTTPDKKAQYAFPSRFGSHSSMIDEDATSKLEDKSRVILVDEYGSYETDRNRLNTRVADPNRFAESRIQKLFVRSGKE